MGGPVRFLKNALQNKVTTRYFNAYLTYGYINQLKVKIVSNTTTRYNCLK